MDREFEKAYKEWNETSSYGVAATSKETFKAGWDAAWDAADAQSEKDAEPL